MDDFFSIPRILTISFWLFSVTTFYMSAMKRKQSIWKALLGEDKKMQLTEVAAFYWVLLFPEVIFLQMLIIVTDLEVRESHLELFAYAQLALTAIAATILFKNGGVKK